jgi:hypothetical protein
MTGATDFDIRDPCRTIFVGKAVAEGTVQLGHLLVANVIKPDGLINRFAGQNWEKCKNKRFHGNSKTKPCNRDKKKNEEDNKKKAKPRFHIFSLFARPEACQVKIDLLEKGRGESAPND